MVETGVRLPLPAHEKRNQYNALSFTMLDGEETIIESAVGGESSAFGVLYDHYQPGIYRFVFVKVTHREEAEDLTHQVFMHAWQNIRSYRNLGFPFSSWLYRIARNKIIDHYRTRKVAISLDDLKTDLIGHDSDHADSTERLLEFERIRRAIDQLKPEYQDVVIMRFIEDLSLRETAKAIRKSEGAVKLIQHRALKQLRTILGE